MRLISAVAWAVLAFAISRTFGAHHYPGWWLDFADVPYVEARERVAPLHLWLTEVRPTASIALVVLAGCGLALLQRAHALGGPFVRVGARAVQLLVVLAVAAVLIPGAGVLAVGAFAALPLCFIHWSPDAWSAWTTAALLAGVVFSVPPSAARSQSLLWLNVACLFVASHAFGVLALTPQAQSWG